MSTLTKYCGIDISALSLDVCFEGEGGSFVWHKLKNNAQGFKQLLNLSTSATHFVMESTGVFHLPLCFYLHDQGCRYSVVNALQVKRYIQMGLERNKSDKKDAQYICRYGIERRPEQYQMPDKQYFECRLLSNSIETLTQEKTSFSNKVYSLSSLNVESSVVKKCYESIIKKLELELAKLEAELDKKLQAWQPELMPLVRSVKGIGKRATAILIIYTQGFKHTQNYQQLISYAGLNPKEYTSGKSIRGKSRITKIGGKQLRHTLYMCALNAMKTNAACKALYDRLVEKGKNKKLAIIAVCNKLLKQVFGVVKSGEFYQDNYVKKSII